MTGSAGRIRKVDTVEMKRQRRFHSHLRRLLKLPIWPQSDQSTRLLQELFDL